MIENRPIGGSMTEANRRIVRRKVGWSAGYLVVVFGQFRGLFFGGWITGLSVFLSLFAFSIRLRGC